MKVLIIGQHFSPEQVSGAVLAWQFCQDLAALGVEVRFVTAAPSYPYGVVYTGYKNRWLQRESLAGILVIRVWSYIHARQSLFHRLLNYVTFSAAAFWGGLASGKPDLIFSYSPPLFLGLSAWALSCWWRIPWVLRVEDLFPDAAVAAGMLKNRLVIRILLGLERWLYARANHISVISDGFRQLLLAKGVPADKLSVIPVWADPEEILPLPRQNDFRLAHGLQNRFVVLYSGNLGLTSTLNEVLDAAALLKDFPSAHFLVVGEGVCKNELVTRAERLGLTNLQFLPYQPRAVYPEVLAAADLTLVTLNPSAAQYSVPGKVFSSMSAARPVLVVAPADCDLAQIVRQADCGWQVEPGDPKSLAVRIRQLACGPAVELEAAGKRGRLALLEKYARAVCVGQYEQLFNKLVNGKYYPA